METYKDLSEASPRVWGFPPKKARSIRCGGIRRPEPSEPKVSGGFPPGKLDLVSIACFANPIRSGAM
jgi:hypothetical protein